MEKDKLPPPPPPSSSSRHYPPKPETAASSSSSSPQVSDDSSNRFSHDVSRMPDFPPRNPGHRRAHSEILGLPDDLNFDTDLGVVGHADGPSFSDETEEDFLAMYLDMEKFGASSGLEMSGGGESSAAAAADGGAQGGGASSSGLGSGRNERPRVRHQHSQSMDGSTELLGSGAEGPSSLAEAKKAMSAAKLADLALVDPKRAKRLVFLNRFDNFIS